MRLLSWLLFLVVFVVGLSFAALNAEVVAIHYYWGDGALPLSLLLAMALALGVVLGILGSLMMVLRSKRELLQLRRQVSLAQSEIKALRALPVKDVD